jgi:hypothetical protein
MPGTKVRIIVSTVFMAAMSLTAKAQSGVDSSAAQVNEARATIVNGQVTRTRDEQPWALSSGERVPIRQEITTGGDGYAHFEVAGGSSFDLYSNSRVIFRENAATAGDLLDVLSGRVRIHLNPTIGQPQQRVFTPVATITATAHEPVTLAIAIDEDETVRVDVVEGEVRVQHTLLPRGDPTLVRAVDAILIQKDEPISRRMDRGYLYRITIKPFKDALSAITLGHAGTHNLLDDPMEGGERILARATPLQ